MLDHFGGLSDRHEVFIPFYIRKIIVLDSSEINVLDFFCKHLM